MTMQIGRNDIRYWSLLAVLAGVFSAFVAAASEPITDPAPGQLLIASAAIKDPRFYHSVILLVGHDRDGAFGIVINRLLAERPLSAMLGAAGGETEEGDKQVDGAIKVYVGGPVQPELGFVVHSSEYQRPETRAVGPVSMTATKEVLRDIAHHAGPAKYLFALGYTGWGRGQLDGEIARHDWFTAPADAELVFDAERDSLWEKALARRLREL